MPKRVYIPVFGPPGLKVDYDPLVSVRVLHTGGEGKEVSPPDPDDPYVVCFRDLDHFHNKLERAREAAQQAALNKRPFGIVIARADFLPRETLDIVRKIGRTAGIEEVPIHVQRLDVQQRD